MGRNYFSFHFIFIHSKYICKSFLDKKTREVTGFTRKKEKLNNKRFLGSFSFESISSMNYLIHTNSQLDSCFRKKSIIGINYLNLIKILTKIFLQTYLL